MKTEKNMAPSLEEIRLFIQYSVPEEETVAALALLERYKSTPMVVKVLGEYYTTLPEEREEAVTQVSTLKNKQGIQLLVVSAKSASYLYVVSAEDIFFLGEYLQEIHSEVLSFFEYPSQKDFLKNCPPVEQLTECKPLTDGNLSNCPVCNVEEGEYHLLGCVVEVCPWCQGQLSGCNCRFEKLETEEIDSEENLDNFIDLLETKGRIRYQANDAPRYPGTSEGLDEGEG